MASAATGEMASAATHHPRMLQPCDTPDACAVQIFSFATNVIVTVIAQLVRFRLIQLPAAAATATRHVPCAGQEYIILYSMI